MFHVKHCGRALVTAALAGLPRADTPHALPHPSSDWILGLWCPARGHAAGHDGVLACQPSRPRAAVSCARWGGAAFAVLGAFAFLAAFALPVALRSAGRHPRTGRLRGSSGLEPQVHGEHRLVEHLTAVLAHDGVGQAEAQQGRTVRGELLGSGTPLHRDEGAPRLEQWHAPTGELVEPGHRASGHEGRRQRARQLLRPRRGAPSRCRARAGPPRRTTTGCGAASAPRGVSRDRVARSPGPPPAAPHPTRRRRGGRPAGRRQPPPRS